MIHQEKFQAYDAFAQNSFHKENYMNFGKLKNNVNFVNTKIFVTSTIQDKTAVLNSGADLYLPKPYEISDLIRWIEYFTNNKA